MPAEAYLGLGSNMGDRIGMLAAALVALGAEDGVRLLRVSRAYESEPWGVEDQPRYANAVALVAFDGEANELLAILRAIEERLGRGPGEVNGPRPIDLDILLFGDEEWDSADLVIPHPRMLERDFVVTPLLEIAPGAALPDGTPITRSRARQGRVVGVLGAIPGLAELEGAPGVADSEEGPRPRPTQEEAVGEWVAVGPARVERGAGMRPTDVTLITYETFLTQAGIPCRFYPHRPNETSFTHPGVPATVRLLVPASRATEAQVLIDEIESTPPDLSDVGEPVEGVDPQDAAAANEEAEAGEDAVREG